MSDTNQLPPEKSETLRPTAGEVPISVFVERPHVAGMIFVAASLIGIVGLVVWMLRPVPVMSTDASAARGVWQGDTAAGIASATQRATELCNAQSPAGDATVELTLLADGKVADVKAEGSFSSETARQCVIEHLSTLQLAPFVGGQRTFKQSLGAPR